MFEIVRGHTIHMPSLGPDPVVLDLGANHGEFSRQMKEHCGGTYYLAEANPDLARTLADEKRFHVWHCAVTGQDGMVGFDISSNDEGSSLVAWAGDREPDPAVVEMIGQKIQRVTVMGRSIDSLLTEVPFREIDLIKMDIEGAEGQALLNIPGATLARIGQITVEYHCDPQFGMDIAREVKESIRYLKHNGFLFINFSGTSLTDVVFINRRRNKIPFWKGKIWELAGARPQWVRNLRRYIPSGARQAFNRGLDGAAGRKRNG